MPDKGEPTDKPNLIALQEEAKAVLADVNNMRAQAADHLKAAEDSRKQVETITASAKVLSEEISQAKTKADESFKAGEGVRKKAEENVGAFNGLLDEIKKFRIQSEEQLKATEAARKKADDDATYASLAKNNTESHAKAVASFKGQAEGEFTTLTTNRQKSDELVQAITVKKAASEEDAKIINDSRKEIEHGAQAIVEAAEKGVARLEEVIESKNSAAASLKEVQGLRDESIQARNKTADAEKEAQQFSAQASTLAEEVLKARDASVGQADEIKEALAAAKTDEENLAKVLEHLGKSDTIATGHEERVAKLSANLEALIQKVEGLLPGATSAGLASAFNSQRKRFGIPQRRWIWAFVICIAALVAVSLPSFIHAAVGDIATSWGEIFRGLAMRLPIVVPLVWLAIYAGRNYMLSLRLEEEYAYKEAVSTSFEGYKREMEQIDAGDANNPTPLTTLCINILRAIAERPGRIYEGKHEDITVLNEMRTVAQRAEEFRQKVIADK